MQYRDLDKGGTLEIEILLEICVIVPMYKRSKIMLAPQFHNLLGCPAAALSLNFPEFSE